MFGTILQPKIKWESSDQTKVVRALSVVWQRWVKTEANTTKNLKTGIKSRSGGLYFPAHHPSLSPSLSQLGLCLLWTSEG